MKLPPPSTGVALCATPRRAPRLTGPDQLAPAERPESGPQQTEGDAAESEHHPVTARHRRVVGDELLLGVDQGQGQGAEESDLAHRGHRGAERLALRQVSRRARAGSSA